MKKITSVTISAMGKQEPVETLADFHSQLHLRLKNFVCNGRKKMSNETTGSVNDIILDLKREYSCINPDADFLKMVAVPDLADKTVLNIKQGQYEHDCQQCVYLGTYRGSKQWLKDVEAPHCFDMYFCLQAKSLILRHGNEGEEYESLPEYSVADIVEKGTFVEQNKILRFIRIYEVYKRHCPTPSEPVRIKTSGCIT